jgi:hypothetical protein
LKVFGKEFKPIKTPKTEGYLPEVDDSPHFTEAEFGKISSFRFDIDYATSDRTY